MCDDSDIEWAHYDDDTLLGHYLIAALDGRWNDQDLLGRELIRRGQLTAPFHRRQLQLTEEHEPLSRPIIAGPGDAELADRHFSGGRP